MKVQLKYKLRPSSLKTKRRKNREKKKGHDFTVGSSYLAALAGVHAVVKPGRFVAAHAALDVQLRRRSVVVVLEEDGALGELGRRLRLQFDGV